MPQEKEPENPRAKFLRRSIWFFMSVFMSFLAFNYGYVHGFMNTRTGVFSPIFQLHKSYLVPELEKDSLIRVLPVVYSRYGVLGELDLQIVYPYSWVVVSKSQERDTQNSLVDEVSYEITNAEESVLLRVEPLDIDFSKSVMSASTNVTLSQQILEKEVVTYNIPEPGEESFITVYREPESDVKISYVQGIKAQADATEEFKKLDNFVIFNHSHDLGDESNMLLRAKVTLELSESLTEEEKEKLLQITDGIVASLRLL